MRESVAVAVVLLAAFIPSPVVADEHGESEGPVVNVEVDISEIVEVIQRLLDAFTDFADTGLEDLLTEVLKAVFFKPFQALANLLVDLLTRVMTSYPDVTMPEVLELHQVVFQLTLLLSVPAFIVVGYTYLTGSLFSIQYEDVHRLIPRLLTAIGFGSAAPWLLAYPVRLSELVTAGLKPANPGFWTVTQLVSEMLVMVVVNAFLLLGIAVMFVIRDVFLLFASAAAPLIALGWALPYSRRYASPLIGAFWGFLLIGPLDMIIFRLVLALLEVDAFELPAWLWAAGGLVLMLAVPYLVLSTGASISGVALAASWRAAGKTRRMAAPHVEPVNSALSDRYSEWSESRRGLREYGRRAKNRFVDGSVDVTLEQNPGGEVEIQKASSLRNAANTAAARFHDDEPNEVEVEENWRQSDMGDWEKEAELGDGDD